MDIALTVFRVGVGVGALLLGTGLIAAVIALRPLVRETRSLARDAARLSRMIDRDLPELLERARIAVADAEQVSQDLAVRLEQAQAGAIGPPGRPGIGSVQSRHAEEGEQIA